MYSKHIPFEILEIVSRKLTDKTKLQIDRVIFFKAVYPGG